MALPQKRLSLAPEKLRVAPERLGFARVELVFALACRVELLYLRHVFSLANEIQNLKPSCGFKDLCFRWPLKFRTSNQAARYFGKTLSQNPQN